MIPGTIKLLDSFGAIVRQARYINGTEQKAFKKRCERLYPAKILSRCTYDILPDELPAQKEQIVKPDKILEPEKHADAVPKKSNFKKKKWGPKGGSTGHKTTQVRASRYY